MFKDWLDRIHGVWDMGDPLGGLDEDEKALLAAGAEFTALGWVGGDDGEGYYLEDEEEIEGVEHGLEEGGYFDADDEADEYEEEFAF